MEYKGTAMEAYELLIDEKVKANAFDIVSADDFRTHSGQTVDARIILERPNVSLYCLDHDRQMALFVETFPHINLFQAPFYFIAQYEHAQKVFAVPYSTLHALVQEVTIDPHDIVLFYSTGRCGSTLISHVMNLHPGVVSFSEPDVFSQLVMLRTAGQSTDEEISALLYASVIMLAAHTQKQGFQLYVFKFRSYVLSLSDLLYQTIPQAKTLFMYRNARTWASSFSRAFGSTDNTMGARLEQSRFRYMIPGVNEHLKRHNNTISWIEYIAYMWVSTMQDSRRLRQSGATLAVARFEDLKATPYQVIQSICAHCGVPMPEQEQLASLLARDAQAGTAGAQDRKEPARQLSNDDLLELERVIRAIDPMLSADSTL